MLVRSGPTDLLAVIPGPRFAVLLAECFDIREGPNDPAVRASYQYTQEDDRDAFVGEKKRS